MATDTVAAQSAERAGGFRADSTPSPRPKT